MLLSIDAMAELPQHRGPEGVDIVWNYLEIRMRLCHTVSDKYPPGDCHS